MKPALITLVGNVGSGKSTLHAKLCETLGGTPVCADEFYKESPFLALEIQDRKRWSLTGDLWFLLKRVNLLKEKLSEKKYPLIVDSGLAMNYVYAYSRVLMGYYTQDEWNLYETIHTELDSQPTQSQVILYLSCPVEKILERIRKRGRAFEIENYSREYLSGLEKSLTHSVEHWKRQGVQVITLDASKDIDVEKLAHKFA